MLVEDDQVALISQLYSGLYTDQVTPPKDQLPKRRRRRKSKGEGSLSEAKKRKLSDEQVNMLEISFGCEHKLESDRKDRLASELGLDPRQVAVWFQNRRARWKNKKLEDEFSKLRKEHETLVVNKCRLETEVISLKDQLKDARIEIQKLQERPTISSTLSPEHNVSSHHSPSSSMTIEYHQTNNNNNNNNNNNIMDAQLLGGDQFGIEGGCLDAMFYVPNTNYVPSVEWMDLYDM